MDYRLPVLTLQELLSNAVKHNAITKRRPLRVSIRVENGQLVVSNPLLPKLDAEPCTGIGLHNLDSRWQLITGHGIRIDRSGEIFSVCMSLLNALEAFKVDSIDYLLKPIKEEEVRRALEKLRRLSGLERSRYSERVERLAERANERQQVFLVRVRDKFIPLQRERIAYCYTSDERVTACTLDGEKYPLDKPLETLQTLLPASDFFRANRQFIVARQAVAEIAVWFGSRLALRLSVETPERIVISKARVPEFKRWLTSVHPAD